MKIGQVNSNRRGSQNDFKEFDCISLQMIDKKTEFMVELLENICPDDRNLALYVDQTHEPSLNYDNMFLCWGYNQCARDSIWIL